MEKSFSVAVEMEDGERRTLTVHGPSGGGVFQQVKAMPGVRRVGRIAEIGANGHVAPARAPNSSAGREQKTDDRQQSPAAGAAASSVFAGTGPRVVLSSRQKTGEKPFKNLYIPPERLAVFKPAPPPAPKPVVKAPVVQPVAAPVAPAPVEESAGQEQTGSLPASLEYRIVKSRRQNGDPYLLQRGEWRELKGKRVFSVDWEKGFAEREQAEAHHKWMRQMAAEMAEVGELDVVEEVEEVEEVEA